MANTSSSDPMKQAAESIERLQRGADAGAPGYLTAALSRLRAAVDAAGREVGEVTPSFDGIEAEVRRRVSLRLAAGLIELAAGLLDAEPAPTGRRPGGAIGAPHARGQE